MTSELPLRRCGLQLQSSETGLLGDTGAEGTDTLEDYKEGLTTERVVRRGIGSLRMTGVCVRPSIPAVVITTAAHPITAAILYIPHKNTFQIKK